MKVLSITALAALILSSLPMGHQALAAGADDLVKCPDFSAVYYLAEDGKRYVFPNEDMFFSWYPDFNEVKTISCEDLATFPIGGRLVYQAGTRLVKIPSDPSVFAVEDDGVLREIPDEDTARDLFGDDWSERVDDVSEAFWPSFTIGDPLTPGEIPAGTIFKDADGHLYRMNSEGVAVSIDVVLDTDDEQVLDENSLPLDEIESRLDVALSLLEVNLNSALDLIRQLLEELRPHSVDDEDKTEVSDVEELEDDAENAAEHADDAINDAEDEMEDAQEDLDEDQSKGEDVTDRQALLDSAEELLAAAQEALAAGDFAAAEDLADQARREAQRAQEKAVDEIEDSQHEGEDNDEDEDGDRRGENSGSDDAADTNSEDSADQEDTSQEDGEDSEDTSGQSEDSSENHDSENSGDSSDNGGEGSDNSGDNN